MHYHDKNDATIYDRKNLISIQHNLQVGKGIKMVVFILAIILAILVVYLYSIFGGIESVNIISETVD